MAGYLRLILPFAAAVGIALVDVVLLVVAALFPIVNPIGGAPVFLAMTDDCSAQMRAALARILLMRPDAMLLDEPSNHLDIESLIWLETFLKGYEGLHDPVQFIKLTPKNTSGILTQGGTILASWPEKTAHKKLRAAYRTAAETAEELVHEAHGSNLITELSSGSPDDRWDAVGYARTASRDLGTLAGCRPSSHPCHPFSPWGRRVGSDCRITSGGPRSWSG